MIYQVIKTVPVVFTAKLLLTLASAVSVECKKQKPCQWYTRKVIQAVWNYLYGELAVKGKRES